MVQDHIHRAYISLDKKLAAILLEWLDKNLVVPPAPPEPQQPAAAAPEAPQAIAVMGEIMNAPAGTAGGQEEGGKGNQ
jgi:hypothetical protein